MLRHEFQPGRLVAGVFLIAGGVAYIGDARGAWETPWFAIVPVVVGGLCLAAVTGLLARFLRKGRKGMGGTRADGHAEGDRAATA
ncbi:hypothetical protein ACFSL4_26190 [Streptomyces caeni]|uniref:DUF3188 domain-containing protein n=1 Tax=Streptomyces caeni TaxID=2307231 RepID=A0ABW4J055_9ACTN